jgi:hypothetical protein
MFDAMARCSPDGEYQPQYMYNTTLNRISLHLPGLQKVKDLGVPEL